MMCDCPVNVIFVSVGVQKRLDLNLLRPVVHWKPHRATEMKRDNDRILYLLNTTTTLFHLPCVALQLCSAVSVPVDD